MKNLIITLAFFLSAKAYAQVGVGIDVPDASAQLDISSSNKGLLPPRINLTSTTDVNTIASPAAGLVVYNTSSSNDLVEGYYFFNGTAWARLQTSINKAVLAENVILSAKYSGMTIITQWGEQPVIPEDLPDGFTCDIINFSNYGYTSNQLTTVNFYSKSTGWNNGEGQTTFSIPSGGTVKLSVVTIDNKKCYFISGEAGQ